MEEQKKIPELRFAGFTDDWNERELSLLAEFSKGQGYSKNDLKATGAPIILYGRLYTNYQTVIDEVDTYTDAQENSYYSYGGEVIVPASGETQEDIVRASVVAKSNIILGGDLNIVKPNESINSNFLALTISNGRVYRELVKKAQGKSVVHIRNGDLKEAIIPYPRKVEQKQIGSFFKNIDELITKHQKKHKRLVTLKKSMLEKMFPKEGQSVPEIRFKGFEEDWNEMKLNQIASYQSSSLTVGDAQQNGSYELYDANSLIGYTNEETLSENYITIIKDGSGVGRLRVLPKNTGFIATLGAIVPNKGIDLTFLLCCLLNTDFNSHIIGATIPHIYFSSYGEVVYCVPTTEEQQKIGVHFMNLDRLIENHKKQLQKLKKFKQSLSEKMFV